MLENNQGIEVVKFQILGQDGHWHTIEVVFEVESTIGYTFDSPNSSRQVAIE